MKKIIALIALSLVLVFIGGCGKKVQQKAQLDELANAPQWVKEAEYEQGKVLQTGMAYETKEGFRAARDAAFNDAKGKIAAILENKYTKIFSRIDPEGKYQDTTMQAKEKLLKLSLESVKMNKLYQTSQTARVYLQAVVDINTLEETIDGFFIQEIQRYNYLFKNYMLLKNSGDLHIILANE